MPSAVGLAPEEISWSDGDRFPVPTQWQAGSGERIQKNGVREITVFFREIDRTIILFLLLCWTWTWTWTHTSPNRFLAAFAWNGSTHTPACTACDLELSFDGPVDLQWRWRKGEMGSFRVASA